jgi:hypothetical protein
MWARMGCALSFCKLGVQAGGIPYRLSPHIAAASEHMHLIKVSHALVYQGPSTISNDTVADSGFGKIHNAADNAIKSTLGY